MFHLSGVKVFSYNPNTQWTALHVKKSKQNCFQKEKQCCQTEPARFEADTFNWHVWLPQTPLRFWFHKQQLGESICFNFIGGEKPACQDEAAAWWEWVLVRRQWMLIIGKLLIALAQKRPHQWRIFCFIKSWSEIIGLAQADGEKKKKRDKMAKFYS